MHGRNGSAIRVLLTGAALLCGAIFLRAQTPAGSKGQPDVSISALKASAAQAASGSTLAGTASTIGSLTGFIRDNPGYSTGYSQREAAILRDFSPRGGAFDPAARGVNLFLPTSGHVYDPDGVPINSDVPVAVPQAFGLGAILPFGAALSPFPGTGVSAYGSPTDFGLSKAFVPSGASSVLPSFDQAVVSALSVNGGVFDAGKGQQFGQQFGDAVLAYNKKLDDYRKQQIDQLMVDNTVKMLSPQVLIKARIIQVGRSNVTDVGTVLNYISRNPKSMNKPTFFTAPDGTVKQENFQLNATFPVPFLAGGPGATLEITSKHIDAIITALEEDFRADTVAAPQLTALNDQLAQFTSGASIPFFFGRNATLDSTNHSQEVFFKHVGVVLEVTPHVLTMQEIAEAFDYTTEGQDLAWMAQNGKINPTQYQEQRQHLIDQAAAGQPIVLSMVYRISEPDTTQFSTSKDATAIMVNSEKAVRAGTAVVRIHNGCGVVISGLINELATDDITKIPVLGDIPLVGNAFRRKTRSRNKFETLIFVEARVMGACDPAADHYEYADRHLPGGPVPGTPHPPFSQVPLAPLEGHLLPTVTREELREGLIKPGATAVEILK